MPETDKAVSERSSVWVEISTCM